MNPLFNLLGNNQNNPMSNVLRLKNDLERFRNGFSGNAQQEVQNLLNSGRMSQEQFNQLQSQAQQILQMFL